LLWNPTRNTSILQKGAHRERGLHMPNACGRP
jgi:hypothetical protein